MRLLLLSASLICAGCTSLPFGAPPVRITILHTNDHHGRFWKSQDGEYGLAARKTLIDRIRAEVGASGGHVLVLDGGDVNTGVPESDLQDAEPDFRGMSLAGYDAMAVGNHEFDKTLAVMQRQRGEWSAFPWLSANIYRDGQRMFAPYKLFELGSVKVAVMGLTTDDTGTMISATRFPGLNFKSPQEEAASLVPLLRKQADVVVAATHMGHYADGKHGANAPGDVELARAVAGIDLIVGGHTHTAVCMTHENVRNDAYEPGGPCAPDRQNGTWIVQAGDWGRFVGRADFEYAGGKFTLTRYRLIPVNLLKQAQPLDRIPENTEALALLRPFQERGAAELSKPVGRSDGRWDGDRASVRFKQTNLGRLIATAMREKTGADAALINSGAIRDSLPAGPLAYRDLLKVQPFGNTIAVVTLSGAELEDFARAVERMTPGSGGYAQTVGMHWQAEPGRERQLWVGGAAVDAAKTYRIALNSFAARGGNGYPDLSSHPGYVDTGWVDAQVLRDFIAQRGVVAAAQFETAVH